MSTDDLSSAVPTISRAPRTEDAPLPLRDASNQSAFEAELLSAAGGGATEGAVVSPAQE